jgi:hypothetical protein
MWWSWEDSNLQPSGYCQEMGEAQCNHSATSTTASRKRRSPQYLSGKLSGRCLGDQLSIGRSGRIWNCASDPLKSFRFSSAAFDFVYSPCVLVSRDESLKRPEAIVNGSKRQAGNGHIGQRPKRIKVRHFATFCQCPLYPAAKSRHSPPRRNAKCAIGRASLMTARPLPTGRKRSVQIPSRLCPQERRASPSTPDPSLADVPWLPRKVLAAFELLLSSVLLGRSLPDPPLSLFIDYQNRALSSQRDKGVRLNSVVALPSGEANHSCSSSSVLGRRPLTPSKSSASLSPLPFVD